MPDKKTFLVKYGEGRLDKYLAGEVRSLSRSYLQKLIEQSRVTVNGMPATSRQLLRAGDKIELSIPAFSTLPKAAAKEIALLHEDKDLVVVDKPAGWVVHPAGPHQSGTLIQRLWPKLAPAWGKTVQDAPLHTARPGVVHRLDRDTSGVIVVAKTPPAADNLSKQFAGRTVEKVYWALVQGAPGAETGNVKSSVGRDRRRPNLMSVSDPGRPSELDFKVLARFADDALLEVRPRTGRTHQIRVQMSSLGHPLVGDQAYGGPSGPRVMLHALSLAFTHPRTKKRLAFQAPLPLDFRKALKERGFDDFPSKKVK